MYEHKITVTLTVVVESKLGFCLTKSRVEDASEVIKKAVKQAAQTIDLPRGLTHAEEPDVYVVVD